MNADSAAAIGSICAAVTSIVIVVGQVILAKRLETVKTLVNGQSHTLTALAADRAFRQGVDVGSGIQSAPAQRAPAQIEPM